MSETTEEDAMSFRPHHMTMLLRHAFLSGRGLSDNDHVSEDDIAAWCAYDPTTLPAYQLWVSALSRTKEG